MESNSFVNDEDEAWKDVDIRGWHSSHIFVSVSATDVLTVHIRFLPVLLSAEALQMQIDRPTEKRTDRRRTPASFLKII